MQGTIVVGSASLFYSNAPFKIYYIVSLSDETYCKGYALQVLTIIGINSLNYSIILMDFTKLSSINDNINIKYIK